MKKQTKQIYFVFILLVIGILVLNNLGILKLFSVTSSAGGISLGIQRLNKTANYTCDTDECIVGGVALFNKGYGKAVVQCTQCTNGGITISFDSNTSCRNTATRCTGVGGSGSTCNGGYCK
jgi:hypothetical protein